MNVKSPNNTSKWQMEFNSAFKGLKREKVTQRQQEDGGTIRMIRLTAQVSCPAGGDKCLGSGSEQQCGVCLLALTVPSVR